MAKYLRKECDDINEVTSDDDDKDDNDDDDDDDDDDANSKDAEVVEISTGEALKMLYGLLNLKYLSKEKRNSLATMKHKDKSAEQKAKWYQWLFYVRIMFVW